MCIRDRINADEVIASRKNFVALVKGARTRATQVLNAARTSANSESATKRLKFNKIDFNMFDGKKEEWIGFKKLFTTYIHDSAELSLLEKHKFLRSKVKGEPATLIESLPIDGSSYEKAWEILLHHYDDPLKRISRHLDSMFRVSSAKGPQLRTLISHFRAQFVALNITVAENRDMSIC